MALAFQIDAFQNDAFQVGGALPEGDPPVVLTTATATLVFTIDGVAWGYKLTTLDINEVINGRNTLSVVVFSLTGASRPEVDDEIIIEDDAGTRIYGGNINDVDEGAYGGESLISLEFRISAVDFNKLADRRHVTADFAAATFKSTLEYLVPTYLSQYGVSLDPLNVDGPIMPIMRFADRSMTDVVNDISTIAETLVGPPQAIVWEIDYDKVMRMYGALDSGHSAPFDITATNGKILGNIRVKPKNTDYANYVILLYGSGDKEIIDELGTGDGIETEFALHYPMVTWEARVNVGGTIVNGVITGGVDETLGFPGSGATWIWDADTNAVTRVSAPTGLILMPYTARYPNRVTADGGGLPADRVERLYTRTDVFDHLIAQALVDSLINQVMVTYKELNYTTEIKGVHPGQTQTITIPRHNVSGIHLVTGVRITDRFESQLLYEVTVIAGTDALPERWYDTYAKWGSGGGGSVAVGAVAVSSSGGKPTYFLGGSSILYVQSPTPDWVAADAVRVTIDTAVRGSVVGTAHVRLRATSGSVTARLRNITEGTTVGTSAPVSSSTWTDAPFAVTLSPGSRVYELQVLPSVANVDVAAVGYFE